MRNLVGSAPSGDIAPQDLSRRLNRVRLLTAIRRYEPVSRPDLERITGLAAGTVQVIVDELLAERLLVASQAPASGSSGRGRPRLLLAVNGGAALIAGVGVYPPDRMQFEVVDLNARSIASLERSDPLPPSGPELTEAIVEGLERLVERAGLTLGQMSRLGVGLPGLVDSRLGVVHWIPNMIDRPYPLAEVLQSRLGVAASIENMASVIARAEYWFGDRRGEDFAIVPVGLGVGLGLYAGGRPLRGAAGLAGEFGQMKTGVESPIPCACGSYDCVAVHAGLVGIVRQARFLGLLPADRSLEWRASITNLIESAGKGDPQIRALFEKGARVLGVALSNLANLIGTPQITVMFATPGVAELMGGEVMRTFQAKTMPPILERTTLDIREGLPGLSQGAAALALEEIYSAPGRGRLIAP